MSHSARIELVKNSLLKNPLAIDKSLYSIVASFNAEEWAEVIGAKGKNLPFYNAIIPYFACAFSSSLADEMIEKRLISTNGCGESLADALFYVLSNGSQLEEEQPSFSELCNKPILLNLFNGSIFKRICDAEFSDDVSTYFRDKFKNTLKSFHNEILINKNAELTPELALTGNNKLCNINDIDDNEVQETLLFIYFLQALKTLVESLDLTELDEETEQKISTLQFQKIIKDSASSKKEERIRMKQFESSFSYIMSNIETECSYNIIVSRLSPMMISNIETCVLKAIFAINATTEEDSDLKEELLTADSLYCDDAHEDSEPAESLFKKIKSSLNSSRGQKKSEKETNQEEFAIDDVLIKAKKKGNKSILIIGALVAALLAGYYAASQAHTKIEQQSSVISNVQGDSASSQYPVIKVTNH